MPPEWLGSNLQESKVRAGHTEVQAQEKWGLNIQENLSGTQCKLGTRWAVSLPMPRGYAECLPGLGPEKGLMPRASVSISSHPPIQPT